MTLLRVLSAAAILAVTAASPRIFGNWFSGFTRPSSQSQAEKLSCICGMPNKEMRIVGGQETEKNQYPWIAGLLLNNWQYCGGSLISDQYVLTAAHCVDGMKTGSLKVQLGHHEKMSSSDNSIVVPIAEYTQHELYEAATFNNDVALIKLAEPVEFSRNIQPICLTSRGADYTGKLATAAGWGATSESGSSSVVLQEVQVPIISNDECRGQGTKYDASEITENMICAGLPQGGLDSCQGDSGGPLVTGVQGRMDQLELIGIVSWGYGCARPGLPGVYTRVGNYVDWIGQRTASSRFCRRS